MAVLPMKKVSIYGLKKDRKNILEALQRRSVVEITDAELKGDGMEKMNTSAQQNTFTKTIALLEEAVSVVEKKNPEKKPVLSSLNGKRELSLEEYYTYAEENEQIVKEANRAVQTAKKIDSLKAEILRLESEIKGIEPWLSLDIPMNFKGTKRTAAFIGSFDGELSCEEIIAAYEKELLTCNLKKEDYPIETEVVSCGSHITSAVIFCAKSSAEKTEEILRAIGFIAPFNTFNAPPLKVMEEREKKISEVKEQIDLCENELKNMKGMKNAFKFMIDYYSMRLDKYKVLSKVNHIGKVFMVTGYVPEKSALGLEAEFTKKFAAAVELEEPAKDDKVPVLLENNAFARPCEGVLETFSLPKKGEIDPTFVMSLFYYVLFGIMLSDLAYGLIMIIVCGFLLLKFKNMESGLSKSLKMFLYCGISTAFWGAMFGGFFGDAVSVVSSTFFGKEIAFKPLWFEPAKEPMRMLSFSFAIGIVHLFTGLFMRLYQCIKNKQYLDALYDVVFWYLLVGGGIVYLLSMDMIKNMMGISFVIPALAANIAAVLAAVGAAGIIFTGGRESKNPFKRLAKGLYSLYNVTGYLSDILSYSRLLALGLATGVIAQVFNKMGSMFGSGILGFILFLVVFLIGHTMNIGINLLGAYVHTNRLQFVEFFGKFYEGGGEKYTPFAAETKYFKIREDV